MDTSKVILLVEDNEDDEELMIRALRKHKITNEVIVARDGDEAVKLLLGGREATSEASALPQLVLLDLNLPKLTGLDVLRRIRADERTRTLPVVVLTSSKENEDVVSSYALGANSYVMKPVDYAQFTEAVRMLGVYWLALNETPTRSV